MKRREYLRAAAFAIASLKSALARPSRAAGDLAGMNVILFLTDQERAIQHFPDGWEAENLPGMIPIAHDAAGFSAGNWVRVAVIQAQPASRCTRSGSAASAASSRSTAATFSSRVA